jgi:hypothetical protein
MNRAKRSIEIFNMRSVTSFNGADDLNGGHFGVAESAIMRNLFDSGSD